MKPASVTMRWATAGEIPSTGSSSSRSSASGRSTAKVSMSTPPSMLHIAMNPPAARSRRMEK